MEDWGELRECETTEMVTGLKLRVEVEDRRGVPVTVTSTSTSDLNRGAGRAAYRKRR